MKKYADDFEMKLNEIESPRDKRNKLILEKLNNVKEMVIKYNKNKRITMQKKAENKLKINKSDPFWQWFYKNGG